VIVSNRLVLLFLSAIPTSTIGTTSRAEQAPPPAMLGSQVAASRPVLGEAVAARDPAWTAVIVYARVSPLLETASLPSQRNTPVKAKPHELDGVASYYSQGVTTASGEPFDRHAMTAAHPTLPFGTEVKVTNLSNGRSAMVRINDRGPFKPGRIIDVSEAAAEALGMQGRGLAPVRVDPITGQN
jgi:rare lipoprotein A